MILYHIMLYRVHLDGAGIELATLVVIDTVANPTAIRSRRPLTLYRELV
jgi:hypothetical protein